MTPAEFLSTEVPSFQLGRIYVVSGGDLDRVLNDTDSLLHQAKDALELDGKMVLTYDSRAKTPYFFNSLITPSRRWTEKAKFARAINGFSYDSPEPIGFRLVSGPTNDAPTITSISPASGDIAGGTSVTITGTGLSGTTMVLFGDSFATINTASATSVNVTTPSALAEGGVDVTVYTDINRQAVLFENISVNMQDFVILVGNEFDINSNTQNPTSYGLISDVMIDLFDAAKTASIQSSNSLRFGITRELFPFISKVYYYNTDADVITFIKDQNPERPQFPGSASVSVSYPMAGETISRGTRYHIKWNTAQIKRGIDVKIELYSGSTFVTDITYNADNVVGAYTTNDGDFLWEVPNSIPVGIDYVVRVTTIATPETFGESGTFAIS